MKPAGILPVAVAPASDKELPRVWPIVLLLVAFAIFDASIVAARSSIETAQFLVLTFVYPQLSLGIAWLALSDWRLLYRIATLACLAIAYLRVAPKDWWSWELTYKMSQFEWFYLPWAQLAIVGGVLWVGRGQGVQIAVGANDCLNMATGRPSQSRFSDVCRALVLIAMVMPMLLSGGFSIGGSWIYVNKPVAWRMTALGAVFAVEALVSLWSVLGKRLRWQAIAVFFAIVWMLGEGVDAMFFSRATAKQIPLAALTHLAVLLTSLYVMRRCGFRLVMRESISARFSELLSWDRVADFTRWVFGALLVVALVGAGYAMQLWYSAAFNYSNAPRAVLSLSAVALVAMWAWLAPGPPLSRAVIFGFGGYYALGGENASGAVLLAISLPMLYLRRGGIRLISHRPDPLLVEFKCLPQVKSRDLFFIIAVIALATLFVRNESAAHLFVLTILFVTFAIITLATLRVEFGSAGSHFWIRARLATPFCAALVFAGRAAPDHFWESFLFFVILFFAYTLMLSLTIGLVRSIGFCLRKEMTAQNRSLAESEESRTTLAVGAE